MTHRTFTHDHRDNPGLHKLYVAWAIETIEVTDRLIQELMEHSRWSSTLVATAANKALREQILEDAAFFEAAAIIKAGAHHEYLNEARSLATEDKAEEATTTAGAAEAEDGDKAEDMDALKELLESINSGRFSATGRIIPAGRAPTLEEIFNGSPWAWLDSIVRPSPRAAISKVMSREEFGKLKPGLYAYAISPLEDGNLLVTSMMD